MFKYSLIYPHACTARASATSTAPVAALSPLTAFNKLTDQRACGWVRAWVRTYNLALLKNWPVLTRGGNGTSLIPHHSFHTIDRK